MDPSSLFFNPSSCNGNMFLGNGDSIFRASRTINIEETSKRQLYFSLPDDLFEEEYYDDQSPEKKRRLSVEQVHLLEKSFETENKLEPERKTQLAKKLGLQPRQVAVWFQNRRARWKTKQLERDYDLLKSSFDVLTHSYNSILNDNQNLKAEVILLSEKLQAKEVKMLEQKPDHELILADVATNADHQSDLQLCMLKVEDRLSTGTDGSVVADGLQMVDNSGDSYFANNHHYTSPVVDEHIHSEEDGTSDDRGCYFYHVPDPATQHQQQQEGRGSYSVGGFGRDT